MQKNGKIEGFQVVNSEGFVLLFLLPFGVDVVYSASHCIVLFFGVYEDSILMFESGKFFTLFCMQSSRIKWQLRVVEPTKAHRLVSKSTFKKLEICADSEKCF